jgi:hypothetical protein
MSTGGAAINATMKQIVAASNVGIIKLPNHPTYNLLSVDVIQLQNCSQVLSCRCCEIVAVIVIKQLVRPSGKWWSYYAPRTLSGDMRDVIYTPHRSRLMGVDNVTNYENPVTFVYLFIILRFAACVNPFCMSTSY